MKFADDVSALSFLSPEEMSTEFVEFFFTLFPFGDIENHPMGEIANDLRLLSHRLHSPNLELLGLVPSARSHCEEFAKQQGIQVEFNCAESVQEK